MFGTKSYKDAAVTGMSCTIDRKFRHDVNLILNKTHLLFLKDNLCSNQCATIILLIKLARDYNKFVITYKPRYHDLMYLKLVEFQCELVKYVGLSGGKCYCTRLNICHDMAKYMHELNDLSMRYKTLNKTLFPVFIFLYRVLNNDLAKVVMQYITKISF